MERDWPTVIAALRRKANDPAVGPEEAKLYNDKADELAKKYNVVESSRTAYNGQVPTWEEFSEFFKQPRYNPGDHSSWVGGNRAGKTHYYYYQQNHANTSGTTYYNMSLYDEWLVYLEEDTKNNSNYEFPQEEGL